MYRTKIFFTASYAGKKYFQKNYDQIVDAIKAQNVELIATEVGNYKKLLTKKDLATAKTERERHYLAIKKGIQWADIIIFELSHESFQIGHEATIALDLKKHVLGLSSTEDWGTRIINRYFHGVKYSPYFIKDTVRDFIEKHSNQTLSERFNLFLSKSQFGKLERKAKEAEMNMSEYLRSLI